MLQSFEISILWALALSAFKDAGNVGWQEACGCFLEEIKSRARKRQVDQCEYLSEHYALCWLVRWRRSGFVSSFVRELNLTAFAARSIS